MNMLFRSILGSGLLVLLLSSNSAFASTNQLNTDLKSQNINTQASTPFYSTAIQNMFGTYAVTCQPCPPGKICPQVCLPPTKPKPPEPPLCKPCPPGRICPQVCIPPDM